MENSSLSTKLQKKIQFESDPTPPPKLNDFRSNPKLEHWNNLQTYLFSQTICQRKVLDRDLGLKGERLSQQLHKNRYLTKQSESWMS